jgi:hypothetical protein
VPGGRGSGAGVEEAGSQGLEGPRESSESRSANHRNDSLNAKEVRDYDISRNHSGLSFAALACCYRGFAQRAEVRKCHLSRSQGQRLPSFSLNRTAESVEGDPCYHNLSALPEKVGGVVVCVPPEQAEQVAREAAELGIRRIWFQQGAESYAAIRYCEKSELSAVSKQCILMFVEPVTSVHRFHRWVWKIIGKYPSASPHS